MRTLPVLALTVGMACFAVADASAQSRPNWRATPIFGTVNLEAGFAPDPATREIAAGGDNRYSQGGCVGYINNSAPDLDLNYTAGSLPLTLSAASSSDVMLVVYTPDGRWLCDDDSAGELNASITIRSPKGGNYNIWIGTASATSERPSAIFGVSEVGTNVHE